MTTDVRRIALIILASVVAGASAPGGDLNPPPGPVAPTLKPLTDVEPRTAVNAANTPGNASASFVISQPGSYYLTGNINADTDKDAIHISADNVTLDASGFVLDGAGATAATSAISITDAYVGVTITDAVITNWAGPSIIGEDASELVLRRLRVADGAGYGVLVGGAHARDCEIHNCAGAFAASADAILEECHITQCTGTTVDVGARSIVRHNDFYDNGTFTIRLSGDDGLIEHNTINGGGTIGINVANGAGTIVRNNTVRQCSTGLFASGASGNTFADNIVENNIVNYTFDPGNTLRLILTEIPQTISWPAHVTLGKDLTGTAGQHGVIIDADDVTLDLNGFSLIGVPGSLHGVTETTDPNNVTITNGAVRNWGDRGIDFIGTSGLTLTGLTLAENAGYGCFTSSSATIIGCEARDNGVFGINTGSFCVVRDCVASGNGANGIATGLSCTVDRCTSVSNGQQGIQVSVNSTITNCNTSYNDLNGLVTSVGCVVTNHTAQENIIYGISAGAGTIVENCTVIRNDSGGIRTSDGCVIRNNSCYDHAGPGIDMLFGDSVRVEGNHCFNNDVGIHCNPTGCFFARNTCAGNTTNYDIAAGNVCLVVSATTTGAAILGDSGGVSPGSTDPNANYAH